jgi:hypothetical protein
MTLQKEVYVEKRGYEGKNRAEIGIREKNVQGGVQDQGGYRTTVFTVVALAHYGPFCSHLAPSLGTPDQAS